MIFWMYRVDLEHILKMYRDTVFMTLVDPDTYRENCIVGGVFICFCRFCSCGCERFSVSPVCVVIQRQVCFPEVLSRDPLSKSVQWRRESTGRYPVNEFADLTTSEFVSEYTGYKPNIVWSGRKQLGTHEYVDEPLDQMKPGTCFQLNDEGPSSFFSRLESELSETLLFFILVS